MYNKPVEPTKHSNGKTKMSLNQANELASNLIERIENGTVVTKAEVKKLEPFIEIHCWHGANAELSDKFSKIVVATGYED